MGRGPVTKAMLTTLLLLALAGWAAAEQPAPAEGSPTLRFAMRAEVADGDRVSLLDMLQPGQELSPQVREQMSALTVTVTPGLGRQIVVYASKVRALLRQVSLPPETVAQVPETMVVIRSCQRLTVEQMTQIFMEAVNERLGAKASEADVHHVEVGRDLVLPLGEMTTTLRFLRSGMIGRVPAVLEVMVDGRRQAQVRMVGTVDVYAQVVVAARPLMQRHVVGPEDIELAKANLTEIGPGAVFDPQEVLGMRTRTVIPLGAPMDLTRLDKAPLIRLGDVVMMVYDLGGVRITAKGRAEQTGFLHGRIKLTNLVSKREVWGRVLDSGSVVVE